MIDLSGYTAKNIEKDMLGQVSDSLDKREGSIIQTAIGPVAWYLEGLYMTLNQIQENAYPSTAVGESLDLIVQTRGLTRLPAVAAVRQGTFDAPVPSGSSFRTVNGADSLVFVSGEQISASGGTYIYKMTCQTPGTAGNSYTGQILPITAIPNLTTATIGEIVIAGTEEESDDALRARYFASFDSAAFGGNIAAYRNTILAIAGVGAVQIYPAWQGGGTVLCVILGTDLTPALPALIEQVQNIICPPDDDGTSPSPNGYGYAPIGAAVTISTGTELTLDITCDIQFDASVQNGAEAYQEEIEQKIQGYLDTVNASWGAPITGQTIEYPVNIYVSRIISAILQIEAVVNVTNLLINGSPNDISCTETAELQQVPVLGEVTINGE